MIDERTIQDLIDNKTKPLGSLGRLETLAKQICLVQQTLSPKITHPAIFVFAADHGLAQEGVSAYPAEVTAQMVLNFARGGAAINVFAKQHKLDLEIVDCGVNYDFDPSLAIRHNKLAKGTANSLYEEALSPDELSQCEQLACTLVREKVASGCNTIGFGEMGIGNTSAASLILSLTTDIPLSKCIGRGTGLDDPGVEHKLEMLTQVRLRHQSLKNPKEVLRAVGGFEIACICFAMLEAKRHGMLILVDGFIASAAALLATKIESTCRQNMIFCHQSEEPGHRRMLEKLNAEPILDLGMRLGEGSACALAFPLVLSATHFINDMASFASAEVSKKTDA